MSVHICKEEKWTIVVRKIRGQRIQTTSDPQHPHDANNGGVDGKGSVDLDFFQCYAHNGQQNNGKIQLVPPEDNRYISYK